MAHHDAIRAAGRGARRRCAPPLAALLGALVACGGEKAQPADSAGAAGQAAAPAVAAAGGGEQLYQRCATCHQANGQGMPGSFPPLAGSPFATAADPSVPIRVVLRGLQGPLTVEGTRYDGVMPAYGTGVPMTDDEVAAVLTYVRSSWGNSASAVTPQQVAETRSALGTATGPMAASELQAMVR